jgi:hypothetical protein
MLVPSFIIIDINKFDDLPDVDMPENAFIAYKIASTSVSDIATFYRNLFLSSKKYKFCLLIELEDVTRGVEFAVAGDFLVSISFHSRYMRDRADQPIVLFVNGAGTDQWKSIVKEAFKSQGYDDVVPVTIAKDDIFLMDPHDANKNNDLPKNFAHLSSRYIAAIKNVTSADASFFFFLENARDLPALLNVVREAELIIRNDLSQIYSLLKENRSLTMYNDQLMSKSERAQEQLDSNTLNYNITIARYKQQVTELLRFYTNEYEILPLWYKRLGHVIKVLMGKRSFRSLFDDKAKE